MTAESRLNHNETTAESLACVQLPEMARALAQSMLAYHETQKA